MKFRDLTATLGSNPICYLNQSTVDCFVGLADGIINCLTATHREEFRGIAEFLHDYLDSPIDVIDGKPVAEISYWLEERCVFGTDLSLVPAFSSYGEFEAGARLGVSLNLPSSTVPVTRAGTAVPVHLFIPSKGMSALNSKRRYRIRQACVAHSIFKVSQAPLNDPTLTPEAYLPFLEVVASKWRQYEEEEKAGWSGYMVLQWLWSLACHFTGRGVIFEALSSDGTWAGSLSYVSCGSYYSYYAFMKQDALASDGFGTFLLAESLPHMDLPVALTCATIADDPKEVYDVYKKHLAHEVVQGLSMYATTEDGYAPYYNISRGAWVYD